jgi:subtilisin family serine protease
VRTRIAGLAAVGLFVLVAWPAFAWAYPDDPYYHSETWLPAIHWSVPNSSYAYPTIAVVDSGMMDGFDEFSNYITPDSADCTSGAPVSATSGAVVDDVSPVPHGTQVASLAAAPINGIALVGVSPFSPVVVVRVTRDGSLDASRVKCALQWLVGLAAGGPLVVNLSMQFGSADGKTLQSVVNALVSRKALLIAATGNRSQGVASGVQWPAAFSHVMAVGDTERAWLLAGKQLDVLAPGTNLYLPQHDRSWEAITPPAGGTSYSTALVSGAAAVVWGAMPDVSNPQVVSYILRATSERSSRWSSSTGFGTINLARALAMAKKPPADDEFEPHDTAQTPFKWSKRILHGIVSASDDPVDWWKLKRVKSCHFRKSRGISVKCKASRKGALVRVTPKRANPLVAYTITFF